MDAAAVIARSVRIGSCDADLNLDVGQELESLQSLMKVHKPCYAIILYAPWQASAHFAWDPQLATDEFREVELIVHHIFSHPNFTNRPTRSNFILS